MDKNSFLEKIKEIGTMENEGDIRVALTELSDSVIPIFDEKETLKEAYLEIHKMLFLPQTLL